MKKQNERQLGRLKRKQRIRQRVGGSPERPRLCVYKSAKHLYAQLIDDSVGKTLESSSTLDKEVKGKIKATVEGAKKLGKLLAQRAIKKGIKKAVFDRNGFRYHGQLKAFADAAREEGLKF